MLETWRIFSLAGDLLLVIPGYLEAVSGYHLEFGTKPVQTKLSYPSILSVADKEVID